ncbi:MAG TPA: VOC family protein [Acidimicrobiia bacterium]|jgi:catechol 2,3-dioxygenase-like lactoylglutathione lyase family enzyme
MKVSNIILRVASMERSLEFYRDALGLGVLSESPEFSFLDAGNIRVALNADATQQPDATNSEVVLEVGDVRSAYEEMKARGVPFEIEPRMVMAHDGRELHAAHFRDPDGHVWSITGWLPPSD